MVIQSHKPAQSGDVTAEISSHLASELKAVEQILRGVIASESPLIREVGEYICLTSGKKLRPIITLLMARALGGDAAATPVHIAAAMEAIHVATLLHDDVIDKASLRRGRPSVNARWGDDVAILMADFLYSAAFELALHHLDPQPLQMICQVTRKMCEGEMFQIERRGQALGAEDYLHIISCKTAGLFSACAALGAISAGGPAAAIAQATAFGMAFGLAFQITDDTLDYMAADAQWGKSVGMDLAAGKQTLPLILTLQEASPEDRAAIEALLGEGRDVRAVFPYFERYGALGRSLETARTYTRQALAQLEGLPRADETALEFLQALPEYVVRRHY